MDECKNNKKPRANAVLFYLESVDFCVFFCKVVHEVLRVELAAGFFEEVLGLVIAGVLMDMCPEPFSYV